MSETKYIPALRFKWLTPVYDFFLNLTMPEQQIKQSLIELANITAKEKVLDFGCGTATLTIMIKESEPGANVAGIDVDVQILKKAIEKAEQKGIDIYLIDYNGAQLPFENNGFNKILSCLVFHHLDTAKKKTILDELYRILGENGKLYIADFGRSKLWLQRILFNTIRMLDGFQSTEVNAKGFLPILIEEAGFKNVVIQKRFKTVFGEVQIIGAAKVKME